MEDLNTNTDNTKIDADNMPITDEEKEISGIVSEMAENNGKKVNVVNKRIDFDKSTFKKLEMMLPIYKEEINGNAGQNEVMSYVIGKAIDKLFKDDFKKKIEELWDVWSLSQEKKKANLYLNNQSKDVALKNVLKKYVKFDSITNPNISNQ